ncbi:mobilization protein [Muribaculaceae bacterium Isolate-007 (NCI)]|nr:mobilization protein [Muribaculaceae bacterium Isolate-100 (HZI)]RXE63780.1 mobilization protein [Muribaculaceae bacterium Isolate-007 (NCI)]
MIATILPGSANFHAVGYNERKVSKGTARLLEILNFERVLNFGPPTPDKLRDYLIEYSERNGRIKKAQFHVAISCKGHEMTEQQLLDFAHQYLKEMGYMEPEQPILIYSHYDTENTHLHIVTSRIAPDGHKIDHNNERRRSQQAIDRILGEDSKKKVEQDFEKAKQYSFNSFAQFKAIMNTMGYVVYQKDDTVYFKKGGKVQMKVPFTDFNDLYKYGVTDRARARQLRSILRKYRDTCADKEELKKEIKAKFGVDIVFFGKKDKPYGYILVDHSTKAVFHGARVLAVDELLDFSTPQERFDRIESFIDNIFTINPKITQGEIFDKLRRHGAYIKKGVVHFNGQTRPLKQFMVEALERNNRIKWIESFNPMTDVERDILCKMGKGTQPDLVSLSTSRNTDYTSSLAKLHSIFNDPNITNVRNELRSEGFIIKTDGDNTFAIDFNRHIIINLTSEGFDLTRLQYKRQQTQQQQQKPKPKKKIFPRVRKLRDAGMGHGENREWEVGYKGNYDKIDDGSNLKR